MFFLIPLMVSTLLGLTVTFYNVPEHCLWSLVFLWLLQPAWSPRASPYLPEIYFPLYKWIIIKKAGSENHANLLTIVEVWQPNYSVEMWTNSTISRFQFILVPPYFSQFSQLPCALAFPNIPVLKHTMIFLSGLLISLEQFFKRHGFFASIGSSISPTLSLLHFREAFPTALIGSPTDKMDTLLPYPLPLEVQFLTGGAVQLCLSWTHMDMLHLSHKHPLFSQAHFF